MSDLETRTGLPDALRVLAESLPRDTWTSHANFDGLTRFWMERHMLFRDVLDRLVTAGEGRLSGDLDPERHARETHHYAGFLLSQLHGHHQIEDQNYFPVLQGLDARLSRGFEILDADHHALDGHIHRLAETTNAYLGVWQGDAARDRAGELLKSLAEFRVFLDRHLTDEEDLVVPVILTYAPDMH